MREWREGEVAFSGEERNLTVAAGLNLLTIALQETDRGEPMFGKTFWFQQITSSYILPLSSLATGISAPPGNTEYRYRECMKIAKHEESKVQ